MGPVAGKEQGKKQGMGAGGVEDARSLLPSGLCLNTKKPRVSRQSKGSPVLGVLGSRVCSDIILIIKRASPRSPHPQRKHIRRVFQLVKSFHFRINPES